MQDLFQTRMLNRLVVSQAAMNSAHFLTLPVLALQFSAVPEIGPNAADFALGLFLAIARIAPLVTGPLADRMGAWPAVRLGLALRSLGLLIVPLVDTVGGANVAVIRWVSESPCTSPPSMPHWGQLRATSVTAC